jgi:hypothetical protein
MHLTSRFPSSSEGYGSKVGKRGGLIEIGRLMVNGGLIDF